jgi:DNA-binding transcriptional LysR family regulator
MNSRPNWDDLRLVLGVASAGSLSGAGRSLGLSHATVFRRLGAIEARLGVRLFERQRDGYAPTAAGDEVAAAARRMEAEVLAVERRVAGQDLKPSGTVRVTTTDSLLIGLLSPILAAFRRAYADIVLEVVVSNEIVNLSRRDADVAIRPSSAPPETLIGRKVATLAQAIYGHRDLFSAGLDIHGAPWVGPDERMAYTVLERWMTAEQLNPQCRFRVDTVLGMLAAVRAGAGLAAIPCYLADDDPRLIRIGATIDALATDLWLLTHRDLRHTARVRAFLDFVAAALKAERDRLERRRPA